jgi:hypothetical protein
MDEQEQEYFFREGLGIWGNESCLQCGTCCYEFNKSLGETCTNLTIKNNQASCKAHDNGERKYDNLCRTYFCGQLTDFKEGQREIRKRGREIAVQIGTVPKEWEELKKQAFPTYLELFCNTYKINSPEK